MHRAKRGEGMKNFHAIEWDEQIFAGARDATLQLQKYALPGGRHRGEVSECVVGAKGATQRCKEVERSIRVAEAVLEFMRKYPGVVAVGAQSPSPEPRMTRLRVTSDTHDCVQAALLNGMDVSWESEADKAAAVSVGAAVLAAGASGVLCSGAWRPSAQ